MVEKLDGITEIPFFEESIAVNEMDFSEQMQIETFEDKSFISEIDEIRVNETAEIMEEVFSPEVLANWSEFSMDERIEKLNEYYIKAGDNLEIHTRGVIVEPMPSEREDMVSFGYNTGDGYIHLNEEVVNDSTQLSKIMDTITHEMRHQFQNDVMDNPRNFTDIPDNILENWAYELTPGNYIDPDYDYQGYYEQAIECDARDFAENVLESYTARMNLN